jgi:hypothetical protein
MKIAAFVFAWFVGALLLALPFGYAMRSTPKLDRLRSEREEGSEAQECDEVAEVAS